MSEPIEVVVLHKFVEWESSPIGRALLSKPLGLLESYGAGYRAALADARDACARACGKKAERWREEAARFDAKGPDAMGYAINCRERAVAAEACASEIRYGTLPG